MIWKICFAMAILFAVTGTAGVYHLQKTGSKSNTISGRGCISCVGSHVFPGDEYAGECGNRAGNVYFSQYSDVCGGYRCG